MISNDVSALVPGPDRSGCPALLLTPKGAVVADLQVLVRDDEIWLEVARFAAAQVVERLSRYVVADDVSLVDASEDWDQLALEGPASLAAVADAAGSELRLAQHAGAPIRIADEPVFAAAFGLSGGRACRLFVPAGAGGKVASALLAAAGDRGLAPASAEALEILRIEAGIPLLGRELGEEVLPAEARLEHAISTTKGCYVGQEIVARLRSRGHVNHLLVGVHFGEGRLPAAGSDLSADGRRSGEITSVCRSPAVGAIGLGFVRREHSEVGTRLAAGEISAEVVALPFVSSTGFASPAEKSA
jgi:folate-binding protein YgfZ